jgi:hypothetical protein
MMGTSHQKGWVSIRGKKWYGYFRRTVLDPETNQLKTVATPIALGLKAKMSKFQTREKLVEEITKLIGPSSGDDSIKNGAVTFGWFVRNRFYPLKEAHWKEETAKVKKLLIQQDLIDEFEDVPPENFDKFTLQLHLNKLAKTRSKDTVLQMRAYLRDSGIHGVRNIRVEVSETQPESGCCREDVSHNNGAGHGFRREGTEIFRREGFEICDNDATKLGKGGGAKCLKYLVDLIGIEPMTSSMPLEMPKG